MDPKTNEAKKEQLDILSKNFKKYVSNKKLFVLIGCILFLLIIIPILVLMSSGGKSKTSQTTKITPTPPQAGQIKKADQPTPVTAKETSQTLVYGTWTSQTSVIRAIDIETDTSKTVATLPLDIKKVSILSSNTLLYIDQTDSNDYGQRLSVFNIAENQIITNIPADSGFGIDDYVLSPNKKYLAVWEVKLSTETQTLQGGQSRVYIIDLSQPTVPNLEYSETVSPTIPIHYPRAVLNDGTLFTDQMIPNDPKGGAGWAYGMSIVALDGSNKQDIGSMTNGTYGSQPTLSPDGKYLLFAGYDGNNGDGTIVKNGYRQALLTPNTVELLDVRTLQRFKLPNLPDTNTYSDVQWAPQTGNVIISVLSPDTKQMGVYSYDLGKLKMTPIPLPTSNGTPYGYISQLTDDKTLIGIQSTDNANLGNLGPTYTFAYTQMATITNDGKNSALSLTDPFMQFMTILPQNYFKDVLGTQTKAVGTTHADQIGTTSPTASSPVPQLDTFFLKTTLASHRLQIKSNPLNTTSAMSCQNLGSARCEALGLTQKTAAYSLCDRTEKALNTASNACY
ncbi:MAG TPA: hypothetical protein VLF93_03720 [Candidatus Saccharimonadales bacterium]|nr:hypothetical protein [Candidatus Saccharimonadales bacterium]